jgi:DNA-binding IclR family transcriptional regulator
MEKSQPAIFLIATILLFGINSVSMQTTPPRSLVRGLRILELLARRRTPVRYSDLVGFLGLPNVTVARLLQALLVLGYVEKDAAGRYRAGPELGALGAHETLDARLRRVCLEPLRRLVERTKNSGALLLWTGDQLVGLERILHEDSVVLLQPGHIVRDLHGYPAGVFCLTSQQWRNALERNDRLRREGATRRWLRQETGRLASHGFACGHTRDKHRLAAPLTGNGGKLLGALSVGGTPSSLPLSRIPSAGKQLAATARQCCLALESTG